MLRFALIVLAPALAFSAMSSARADNEAETRFINAYLQAHSTRDLKGVLGLFPERPGAEMEKRLRVVLEHSFGAPIKKIELVPEKPAPNPPANADDDKARKFKVTHNLVVCFPEDAIGYTRISYPVGWKDGKLCLAPVSPADGK